MKEVTTTEGSFNAVQKRRPILLQRFQLCFPKRCQADRYVGLLHRNIDDLDILKRLVKLVRLGVLNRMYHL